MSSELTDKKRVLKAESVKQKEPTLLVDVVTTFPEMFEGPFGESMLRIAQEKNIVQLRLVQLRDYAEGKHKLTDDKPFGGGPGMVMKPEPFFNCVEELKKNSPEAHVILLTPAGTKFEQKKADELSKKKHLILLCGHYEGVDERVRECLVDEEISLGDFVLTGGEIPSMALVDSVTRLIPGVLGNDESIRYESFQSNSLDHPHYTRPKIYRGHEVPEELVSGNHAQIESWRKQQAMQRTGDRRPDLLK